MYHPQTWVVNLVKPLSSVYGVRPPPLSDLQGTMIPASNLQIKYFEEGSVEIPIDLLFIIYILRHMDNRSG